jgi:PAS domain S-box-containing protein
LDDSWSYRFVAEAVPNLVFVTSPTRAIQYGNRAFLEYAGAGPDGGLEPDWTTLVHPLDRERVLASWRQSLGSEKPCDLKLRLRSTDQSYRWHLLRLVPLRKRDEPVSGWLASATDIDDYQRGEDVRQFFASSMQAMYGSLNYQQTLRTLAELVVPDWADICTVDILGEDRSIERVEVACADPAKEDIARRIRVSDWFVSPDKEETVAQAILRGSDVFVPSVTEEWLLQVAPEQEVDEAIALEACSAICVPLRARNRTIGALAFVSAESGRIYSERELGLARGLAGRAGVIIDNARLYAMSRKATEELREANRVKDEFLGMMSHELRTPITTIYGNAQVLQRMVSYLDRDAVAAALDDIKHDSERLQLIIENLLALARDAESRGRDVEPVLIARILERLRDVHLRNYPQRQLELRIEDAQTCASANPTFLDLVVRNLLNNAEKYSPASRPIEVSLESTASDAIVRVLDRGHGIPGEEIDSIFKPFFRSEALRDQVPGVGIGLTVCKRLVEAQNGRIWARGREGGGTELCFALPIENELSSGH